MTAKRRAAMALAALAIGTLLAIALGEAALRIAGFRYQFYPDKIEFGWPDPKEFSNVYVSDPEVLWTQADYPQRLAQAKAKRARMVFMGCSCTEFGKYDQFLAEEVAAKDPKARLSYLNVGVGGWTSHQGLHQLRRDVLPLKPEVVCIFYGWNDHWFGFGIADKEVSHFTESALYPLRNVRLVQLGVRMSVAMGKKADEVRPPRVSVEDFRANLTAMVREAKAAGIAPVLLTGPSSHWPGREYAYLARRWLNNPADVVPLHERYAAAVRDVAAAEGATLCDLKAQFEALPRTDVARRYFQMDGIHLRPEGDRLIAQYLYDCLSGAGLLAKALAAPGDAAELPGRDYPGGGNPLPPVKEPGDPKLPTVVEVAKAELRSRGRELRVRGIALSPKVIDHVLVFAEGQAMGAANYPARNAEARARHPEFNDEWCEFLLERPLPAAMQGRKEMKGEVVAFSGEDEIARVPFAAAD